MQVIDATSSYLDDAVNASLPDGVTLRYLSRLTNVTPEWIIHVRFTDDLADDKAAGLIVDPGISLAVVLLNAKFHFSRRALTRSISHELLELQSIDQWLAFVRLSRQLTTDVLAITSAEGEYRRVRDHGIDYKLSCLPWFDPWDVPVPRSCITEVKTSFYQGAWAHGGLNHVYYVRGN